MKLTQSERLALCHTLAKFPDDASYDQIHSLIYCGDYRNDENPIIVPWTPYENMTGADLIQTQDDLVWALDALIVNILGEQVMQPLERLATETADWIPAQASMSPTLFTDAAAAYRKLAEIRNSIKINVEFWT